MSILTTIWTMISGACLMLCLLHLLLWWKDRHQRFYLLSALMAAASSASALIELGLMRSDTIAAQAALLRIQNVVIAIMLVAMVWFVQGYLRTGRRWLAAAITASWAFCVAVNLRSPHSLVFAEIHEVLPLKTFWGETFMTARGTTHPLKVVADLTSIAITLFVADATVRAWRRGRRRAAAVVGAAITVFVVVAGIHTPLVDSGKVATPFMISVAFLTIVSALSYQVADDASRALRARRDLEQTRGRLDRVFRASMLGELVSALSHELNQPLAAILSNAQAARRYLAHDEPRLAEVRHILDQIVMDEKRAATVIQRLRALMERGETVRERIDLAPLVDEVVALVRPELDRQQVRLDVALATDIPPVLAGSVEVQQVLLNLLLNAVRALESVPPRERRISVAVRGEAGFVTVTLADTGPGIAEDLVDHLFEPFHGDRAGHLGMGLSICRRIVEAYDGSIRAENDGTGARFHFSLPAAEALKQVAHG